MVEAHAFVITLSRVDPHHYGTWDGSMPAAPHDAKAMTALLKTRQIPVRSFSDKHANSKDILDALADKAQQLDDGSLLILYYSGHGAQLPDLNKNEASDSFDETWCLFDRMLVDDELDSALLRFKTGVRVVVISDSCHSGGIAGFSPLRIVSRLKHLLFGQWFSREPRIRRSKAAPGGAIRDVYTAHQKFYDAILSQPPVSLKNANAAILLMAACEEWGTAEIGEVSSRYTQAMELVWDGGKFKGTYAALQSAAAEKLTKFQKPKMVSCGAAGSALPQQTAFKF